MCTDQSLTAKAFKDGKEIIEDLKDRIVGRYSAEDIIDPETERIIVEKDDNDHRRYS